MQTKTEGRPALYWHGPAPNACDCCGIGIHSVFVDGATDRGQWGNLHPTCHERIGRGLGAGRGQRYEKQVDGRWLRMEG
jgi:hypothetical protein